MSNLIKVCLVLISLALTIALIAKQELASTVQPGLISLSWEQIENLIKKGER